MSSSPVRPVSRKGVAGAADREGLVVLEGEGLVVSQRHRGTRVRELDREAWQAIRSQVHLVLLARIAGDGTCRDHVVPEHANLAAVIGVGDVEQAALAAEEHLRGSCAKLVEQR